MSYSERPDPDEPWRYQCVVCGSVTIRVSSRGIERGPDKTVRCSNCRTTMSTIIDRKENHPKKIPVERVVDNR